MSVNEIVDCSDSITEYYNSLIEYNRLRDSGSAKYNEYEHKKRIWMCLMSVNILEGVRFYVSFACSWAFACLLYTSPSPRDAHESRMPSSA